MSAVSDNVDSTLYALRLLWDFLTHTLSSLGESCWLCGVTHLASVCSDHPFLCSLAFCSVLPVWCMPFSLPFSLPKALPCVVHALLTPRQPSQSCPLCGACPSHSPSAFPKLSPVWCMPFSLPVSLPKAVPCVVHALLTPRQPSQSSPLCGACPSHSPSAFPKLSPVWCMPFSLPVSLPEAIPSTLHCMA